MFTSLSKIISWSPNPWCDGVMVHEVFDRVLVRLGLERGNIAGSSHVTAQQLTSWGSGLTLSGNRVPEVNAAYSAQSVVLQGLQQKTRWSSKGCLSTGWPPNGINVLNYAYIAFCLFFKNCLEPQLLRFLLGNLIFLLHCRSWICYPVPCTGSYTTDTHMGAFPF